MPFGMTPKIPDGAAQAVNYAVASEVIFSERVIVLLQLRFWAPLPLIPPAPLVVIHTTDINEHR
tara:strand:- start:94 stop:285 length:192 start_codon:yes stop_codon:yes gene_type:complete